MRISLNGRPEEIEPATTVGALVDAVAGDRRGVAVAIDGEVVARKAWDTSAVPEGAVVELVGAVQGG